MTEKAFSTKVVKLLRAIPKTYVVRTQAGSIGGIPDLLIYHRGLPFAWELKTGNNKATALQLKVIADMGNAGVMAYVVTPENLNTALTLLHKLGGAAHG